MTAKHRSQRTPGHRLADAGDLRQALKHCQQNGNKALGFSQPDQELPPQQPPFLGDIPPVGAVYQPRHQATKDLKAIIEENYYQANFQAAINRVSAQHIPELDQIRTLDQFYYYVDRLVAWIPEIRVWSWNGEVLHERTVYTRICQFYYYFNQQSLEALQSPIDPVEGAELSPISKWLREFAVDWGAFLDTPQSREFLVTFKYAPEYSWQEFQKAPEDYATFNAFFARQFKDITTQRPVAQTDNDRVIVFPAESTFVDQFPVSTEVGPPMPAAPSIVVKHIEWPIAELLRDSAYGKDFEGGLLCHSFLNTYDYHRLHTPVRGKVLEAKFIPGQVYLEVDVQEQEPGNIEHGDLANAVIPKRYLNAEDATGYQFVQCRGLIVLDSPIGKVAVLPMGMAQVSSVVFVRPESDHHAPIVLTDEEKQGLNYQQQVDLLNRKISDALVGKELTKGEMFSYFQFGGSDCVVVFERKANVDITAIINRHYPVRSQYGLANINL